MESMLDQFELLNFEIENEVDWLLDSEAPLVPLNRHEVSEWIEEVYQNPEIDANKRLLVNALDIIISRKHANDFRSNSHEGNPSLTPSRDLTDIQILARMQEDSLRQSTLQRTRTKNRKKSTPTEQWSAELQAELRAQTNSERIESYISAPDAYNRSFSAENGNGQDAQNVEHENEAPVDNFRARNYADQGTFRVKKKNSDNIKRPIIEAGHKSRPLYNYEEDEEFERTEHSVLSECSSNTNSSSLSELVAANSRMIHDTKLGEANHERLTLQAQGQLQQQQRPIIRARGNNNTSNNNLIPRPSINYSSALPTTTAASKAHTTTVSRANTQMPQQQQQAEQKARNRSIPRVRTGIPVMSTASNSHHSAINNNGTQNGASGKSRASMAASRSISPRRRNSSGSVLTAVPPLKATAPGRQTENGQSTNRKLQLPASLSSNNLRHARSNGRIDKMSVASSDYGLNDEFY